jgi:hypothetical protein
MLRVFRALKVALIAAFAINPRLRKKIIIGCILCGLILVGTGVGIGMLLSNL